MEKQQPLCCCQLLHRPLTETSLFLDLLGTMTPVVLLWLALCSDFKPLLQAQGGPIALLCSSSGTHATELSYQRSS
ncbi:mCG148002 [Mus musculus]|nr:mCG148002 [Mus musculus]